MGSLVAVCRAAMLMNNNAMKRQPRHQVGLANCQARLRIAPRRKSSQASTQEREKPKTKRKKDLIACRSYQP